MRFSTLVKAASAVAFASLVSAEGDSDVISLTASTFEEVVNPESLILVEFFAPWCGHCKSLAPHYEEAATALKEKGIKIAKVDCVDQADLCQAHGVQGYPTLKVFHDGNPSEYTGPRKADGIISYMVKQSLPAVSEVTAANLEEFQKSDKLVVVVYLSSPTSEPAPEFSAAANKHRDTYLFGLTTDPEAIAAADVTPPAIVVYRSYDEPSVEYPYPAPSATVKDIEEWVADLSIPIIDELNAENYANYAASGKSLAYLFLDPAEEHRDEYVEAIRPVATKYRGKINFVWIDAIKFGEHAKALNLVEARWPSFVIQDLANQLKYPYDQSLTVEPEAVDELAEQYLAGKLEPSLKSEAIPETQDESVVVVVGKSFDDVVFDDSKDVFIELYATWCGHCKRLKPTWDSLADHFAGVKDSLVIAKMDAPENDLPPSVPFRVSSFPTLKFKPAGSTEFIDYNGDRSLESLIAFVEENAKNSLEAAEPEARVVEPEAEAQVVIEQHDEL